MIVPQRFLNAINGDPGNCVLLVGAGLSKSGVRQGGAGIPDWDLLMRLMIDHLSDSGRCKADVLAGLRNMLDDDPPRYTEIAEEFWRAHINDRDGYETFLRRLLMPDDLTNSETHRQILRVGFRGIATFNFDNVFEHQSDRLTPIVYPELLEQIGQFQRKGFFAKIHGSIDRPANSLVLTKTSYEQLSRHPNYGALLAALFLANKVLCVGFSMRDPDFLGVLQDLKDRWGSDFPPLFALMRERESLQRQEWLAKGVDIIPYADHADVEKFFAALAPREQSDSGGTGDAEAIDEEPISSLVDEWRRAQTVEAMDRLISDAIAEQPTDHRKELMMVQIWVRVQGQYGESHLLRPLIRVGTPLCLDIAGHLLFSSSGQEKLPEPNVANVPVHDFALRRAGWGAGRSKRDLFKWLLDPRWQEHGVDLLVTFGNIRTRVLSDHGRSGLDDLYAVCSHVPGATREIEEIVLSPSFVPKGKRTQDYHTSQRSQVYRSVLREKIRREIATPSHYGGLIDILSPSEMLQRAHQLETMNGQNCYPECTDVVLEHLLDTFVQTSFMTLHGHSSLYDPQKSDLILDALSALRGTDKQLHVLWSIDMWPESRQGLGSLAEDMKSLRELLFAMLWWRFTTETRLEYLKSISHRLGAPLLWTGQPMLGELMGLRPDADREFLAQFTESLESYRVGSEFEPRPLQEVWYETQELKYELTDEVPPELIRRIATKRIDWDRWEPGEPAWIKARSRAAALMEQDDALRRTILPYVIDGLLGAYIPASRLIRLYKRMISLVSSALDCDEDALMTIVYVHETVHAYAHLGLDLDGQPSTVAWQYTERTPSIPISKPSEAIAQWYTWHLLKRINDSELVRVFVALEESSSEEYRAWRDAEPWSFEAMRSAVMHVRRGQAEWPPSA